MRHGPSQPYAIWLRIVKTITGPVPRRLAPEFAVRPPAAVCSDECAAPERPDPNQ